MLNNINYTINNVPTERIGILKYLLKNRLSIIFMIFFFSIPLFSPLLIWIVYSRFYLYTFPNDINNLLNYILFKNFIEMILLFIASYGIAGLMYSYRRLLFNKTLKVSYHFFKGMKESGFEFGIFSIVIYLIYSIFEYIFDAILITYRNNNLNIVLFIIISIIILLIIYFLIYILIHMYTSASLYVVSFRQAYLDAFKAIKIDFIKDFLLFIILFIPFTFIYISFISNTKILFILSLVLLMLFTMIFGLLIITTKIYDKFDETINKYIYKELYKIGLKDYYAKDK